jgi:RNA polymerase sigma-70 factor (ECF subfamily)
VGTYLTRIAINLSLNELKRRKRRRSRFSEKPSDEMADVMDNPERELYNDEKEIVQRAIQQLEPKFRSVVVLRMIEGYTTKEAADILKIPVGTVLSRLTRAQMKLSERLTPYYGGSDE